MYKARYNICPPYIKDLFKLDKSRYGLRNSGDFLIPRYNTTTYGKHSFRYMGPVIWSKLSNGSTRFTNSDLTIQRSLLTAGPREQYISAVRNWPGILQSLPNNRTSGPAQPRKRLVLLALYCANPLRCC